MALALGLKAFDYRLGSIGQSVFYAHHLPESCAKVLGAAMGGPLPQTKWGHTALGSKGLAGATYGAWNEAILAHKLACQMNSYFWKQQDLRIPPGDLVQFLARVVSTMG